MDVKCQIHAILEVSSSFNPKSVFLTNFVVLEFCPADCDWSKERVCPGMWENGQQITSDTCIPMKNGDCMNHCPMHCGKEQMMCPGKMDPNGCKMPDMCLPAGGQCPAP